MNFLAHIFLSDQSEEIMIGNFIADFIKGNNYQHLPEGVIKGIKLHRAIDEFTDTHLIVRNDIKLFSPYYQRYSGIVVDILYDYFLVNNWKQFSSYDLEEFILNFYSIVELHFDMLPEILKEVFPKMKSENWLLNYGNIEGLNRTFVGMENRLEGKVHLKDVTQRLLENRAKLEEDFKLFFPDLVTYVQHYRMILN